MNERQRLAARLLGRGKTQVAVADELGVDVATVRRWQRVDGFQEAVKAARDELLAENPEVRRVLLEALEATRKDGQPDWQARLTAARLLLLRPEAAGREPEAAYVIVRRTDADT